MGGDEVNLILLGENYGWPLASYGINYDGNIITENLTVPGTRQPVWYWVPSIAVCGTRSSASGKNSPAGRTTCSWAGWATRNSAAW